MKHRITLATSTAMAIGLLSTPIFAQDATPNAQYLGRIIIGHSADNTPIYAGENTSVIEGDALTGQGGMTSLNEVLRQTPGVTTLMNKGQPGIAIAVRGFGGSHVNTKIEGVPQTFRFTAHNNADGFAYVDPMMLSSVDITRGSSITDGGMAGSVNMRLLSASDIVRGDEGMGGLVRLRYGDNGKGFASMASAAMKKGPAELTFAASRTSLDDFENGAGATQIDTNQDIGSLMLRGAYQVNDALRVSLLAMDYQTSYGSTQNGFMPGTFVIYDMEVTNQIYNLGFDYSGDSDLIGLSGNIYSGTTEHLHVAGNGLAVGRKMETQTRGINLQNISRFAMGDWDVTSTNGFDISRDKLSGTTGGSNPTSGDAQRLALFSENVFANGAFEMMLGLRYSSYKLDWTNATGKDVKISEDSVDPKLTLAYQVNDIFQPYVSAYRTSRAPSLQETFLGGISGSSHSGIGSYHNNPDLRTETSNGYEIGTNITHDGLFTANDKLTGRVAYYNLDVKNFIVGQPQKPYGMKFINIDETVKTEGLEVEIGYESDRFSAVLSWANTSGSYSNGRLQPKDAISATVAGHFLDGALTLGTTYVYNSNGPAAIAFESDVDRGSYSTWDLFASYDVSENFSLNAKVSNVTDELYTPWAATANSAPGRSAYIGGEIRF